MFVPISPEELVRKCRAIFKNQSQKDNVMLQSSDKREFWERAENRNHGTTQIYVVFGLAVYEAMKTIVRWKYS